MEGLGIESGAAAEFVAAGAWNGAQHDDHEDRPAMGLAFEAFLNPMELKMARRFVGDLAPRDAQEEVHAWHLAAGHLLAAQRIGKSRQEGLTTRAEQIEVGLAVRLMTLADRKSTALDRHRAFRLKMADEAEHRASARAIQEAEEMKRVAEEAEQAEWAAWRRMCSEQRVPDDGQEAQVAPKDHAEREAPGDHAGREAPEAPGNGNAAAAPVLSDGEAADQLAWEQAIEASRPDPRDDAEADGAEEPGPAMPPAPAPGSQSGAGPGSEPGTGPGSEFGTGPGSEFGQAPLSGQQRRALARRAKKKALRARRRTS